MFLKSLEIRGFKSFADKTELKFRKGITAVVGPNGSGKSNISDSVRWVLGEQSIKTLRGGKMEDVIFAGTQFRKPVGLAQVSLTLNNEDGSLETEYNEVTISRRIFRSGEAEYLINGTKCRLKDITQLFMDTGIGKEGYSLIGQGKIEAILSGKPEERRGLIEEAAGIVRYKSRKMEAEKKLENTENNLIRIRDIISTYEERLEPLKLEREKALKYKTLADELTTKEVSLVVHFINSIEIELQKFNEDVQDKQHALDIKKVKLLQIKDEVKLLQQEIEEKENKNEHNKKEYYNKKEMIVQKSNEIILQKERIKNSKDSINKNKQFLEEVNNNIQKLLNDKLLLEEELLKLKEKQKLKDCEIKKIESENIEIDLTINSMESEIKSLKEEEFELLRGYSEMKNSITLIANDIKIREEKEVELNKGINSFKGNMKINIGTLEGLKEKVQLTKSTVKTLEDGIIEKKKRIIIIQRNIAEKESEFRALNKRINEFEANKNMIINLEKHYEGYNRTVKNLMDKIKGGSLNYAKDTKVLGEIFTVEKKYEVAIEIALGGAISNIITEDDKIAKDLINFLKSNNLGRATFLPLNNIRGDKLNIQSHIKEIEGYLGIASEVINYESKFSKAINNVLGRIVVCKDMNSAINISKKSNNSYRIVTLEGEVIAPGGAMTGGSIRVKNTNILGRKREIEELTESLKDNSDKLRKVINEIESLKANLKESDEGILNDRDLIHFKNIETTKDESEIISLTNESSKLSHSIEISKGEIDRNRQEIERLQKTLSEREKNLCQINVQNLSNKERVEKLEKELEKNRENISFMRNNLTDLKISKASFDEIIQNKENEILRKENEIKENKNKIEEYDLEVNENSKKIKELEGIIKIIDKIIIDCNNRVLVLEESFKREELDKGKLKESYKVKDTEILELIDIINKEEGNLNKSEIQKVKSEMEKESLYTKLNEEIELTFAEAIDIAIEVSDVNKYKEDISKLKGKVTSLGSVNLAAIEEYLEVKEKFEFMYSQEQDLERAKSELVSVINEMTEKMKELFRENFKKLNENFKETFRELFKGGNGELILSEGDELSANIDINVEPPGKKLQNINLMSGGEKVLSAIALLFAILKMKPTPFCILDEIEAALDDSNVSRYAEFLKEFAKKTQFIVITHRKGTMEASDMLYGVTMEEKGISKVVSVDLTNAQI